jgi:hypothetical protein
MIETRRKPEISRPSGELAGARRHDYHAIDAARHRRPCACCSDGCRSQDGPFGEAPSCRRDERRCASNLGRRRAATAPVFIASAEDTIVAKLEWSKQSGGSERQRRDIAGILAMMVDQLDRAYIGERVPVCWTVAANTWAFGGVLTLPCPPPHPTNVITRHPTTNRIAESCVCDAGRTTRVAIIRAPFMVRRLVVRPSTPRSSVRSRYFATTAVGRWIRPSGGA